MFTQTVDQMKSRDENPICSVTILMIQETEIPRFLEKVFLKPISFTKFKQMVLMR